jgi:hypothetical protein
MICPLIKKIRELLECIYNCKLFTLLVLRWLFCNKLGFGDFGGFDKLGDKFNLLILREIWSNLDKNPPRRLEV